MGTRVLSWRDVWIVASSAVAGSRLAAALDERASWTFDQYLAAASLDALNLLVWSKTKDGARNRNRPKPITRPGEKPPSRFTDVQAMPLDEMKKFLAQEWA